LIPLDKKKFMAKLLYTRALEGGMCELAQAESGNKNRSKNHRKKTAGPDKTPAKAPAFVPLKEPAKQPSDSWCSIAANHSY
jgi:hypothetical protein